MASITERARTETTPWTWEELREIAEGPREGVHEFCRVYGRAGALALVLAQGHNGNCLACSHSANGLPILLCYMDCPGHGKCGGTRNYDVQGLGAWLRSEAHSAGIELVEMEMPK